jgi:hypothetical protein
MPSSGLTARRRAGNDSASAKRIAINAPPGIDPRIARGQNRALVVDPNRDLVLVVLGANDRSQSLVFALRYRHDQATFIP